MAMTTAEQAADEAKVLTYEQFMEALTKSNKAFEKRNQAFEKKLERSRREFEEEMKRSRREYEMKLDESQKRIEKNLGGIGNSIGELIEEMFRAQLCDKFTELGFTVHGQAGSKTIYKDGRVVAEADDFLENGDYIILVEIKTKLTKEDVDDHIERIETFRACMDERNDNRKIIGAVAGGVVPKNMIRYAQKKGFYVLTQSGEAAAIAKMPKDFKAREWISVNT